MTGTEIYKNALINLGYDDDVVFKNKSVVVINQICEQVARIMGANFAPIRGLAEKIELDDKARSALVYGVAQRLALGEGDGELQQYFAREFDNSLRRLTNTADIKTVI